MSSYICPDGSEEWQDGYRDARFHAANRARGNLDSIDSGCYIYRLITEDNAGPEYVDGYLTAVKDVCTELLDRNYCPPQDDEES